VSSGSIVIATLLTRPTATLFPQAGRGHDTTIHKSQGSEYQAVVIPLTTQHYPMLKRNLVYTAITRGRKLVVLIGQRRALAMAVKNDTSRRRYTKLRERLAVRSAAST
jgi:exodeoxyribonuclease V alpha subunit